LLRDELGFEGVVFTDCLEMAAIAAGLGTVAGAVQSFVAGADIVLVSHTYERQRDTVLALQAQLASGELSVARLEQSLARISRLKQSLAMDDWAAPFEPQQLQMPDALTLAAQVQANAVQVCEPFQALDLSLPTLLITVEVQTRTEIDEVALGKSTAARGTLLPLLAAAGLAVNELIVSPAPTEAEIAALVHAAASYSQLIVQTYNACLSAAQQDLLARLPVEQLWLVAGRLPYDLALLPRAKGRLAACSNRPAALVPVAQRLLAATTF
jgi:beta-N-acetylhexosaminidase